MSFGGTKGTIRFDVANSIPVSEIRDLIAEDSRYSRKFEENEGIIIRTPLLSGLIPNRDGVYYGFAASYNENVNFDTPVAQIQNLPRQITQLKHNPDNWYLNEAYGVGQLPSHNFTSETDGKLTITISEHGLAQTQPASIMPRVKEEGFLGNLSYGGYTGLSVVTSVPYLWGSVVEGTRSGARRFIVGPLIETLSNPSLANETEVGEYFDLAESGTGPYGRNQLRFIMPDTPSGVTASDGANRKNIFNYTIGSQVKLSNPINDNFMLGTPFSPSRIDYSGFRLYNRKNLPTPYNVPDKETTDSFYNGPSVEPEKTVYGTSGNDITVSWPFIGAFTTDPTRRQAFAITKRHVLGFSAPQHAYPFSSTNNLEPDYYGFSRGVTGKVPFTDSAEYGQGDKILFWDGIQNRVIERTIIDTKIIDVEAFRESVNSILSGAIPALESSWNCVMVEDPVYGAVNECTIATEGYGIDLAFGNYVRASRDRQPQGGSVCTSIVPQVIPWKGVRQNIVDDGGDEETDPLKYAATHFSIRNNRNAFNYFNFDLSFSGISGGFDFIPRYLHSGPINGSGATSFASGKTGYHYPNPKIVVKNFTNANDDGKYPIVISSQEFLGVNSLLPESTVIDETLFAVTRNKALLDDQLTSDVYSSERLSPVRGIASFSVTSTPTPNIVGIGVNSGDDPQPFGTYPPKDNDETVPESKVKDQFSYLPTAARNAIKNYFPHGLNNIFFGSFFDQDLFRKYITWHYLISHFKPLLSANCAVHLLDKDLPEGVTPISFVDVRRSKLHKYELHFDDQMKGHLSQNCPQKASFTPYWSFGNPTVAADGWGGFAIGSRAVAYSNPYGSQAVTFEMTKVGRCQDTYDDNFLQSCEETQGMTSGPKCRWGVWSISVGSGGEVWAGPSVPADGQVFDGCYRCWNENPLDPLSSRKPSGTVNEDRLLRPLKTDGYFRGGDIPSPMFTYNADGVPIMSRVVVGSAYRSNYSQFKYLYEYSITGVNEGNQFLKPNTFVFQNYDGSTGADGMFNGYAQAYVHKYSPDSGRLTLGFYGDPATANQIYSDDHLINCHANVCGETPSGQEPCLNGGWILAKFSECNPDTKTFAHTLGKPAYIHNALGGGWASVQRGGPRVLGAYAGYGLWTYGYIFNGTIAGGLAKYDDCTYPSDTDYQTSFYEQQNSKSLSKPVGTAWQTFLATHNMGTFLSDQKIYHRTGNPNDITPYAYFGRVRDIFDRILDNLSTKNGVPSGIYPTTKVITFDPTKSDLVQPMVSEYTPVPAKFKSIYNKSPGVYTSEYPS